MPRSSRSTEDTLAALSARDWGRDEKGDRERLDRALGERHGRVVAKAAEIIGERLLYDHLRALVAAFRRFLEDPVKRDPGCIAKGAIARALVALDCDDSTFWLEGLRYEQREPVWGGSVDTAVDVRNSCAMGLVACGYSRALHEIVTLLNDPEPRVRQGAVRAIACAQPREAELLLRFKALIGDAEPEVIGECFAGLLSAAPEQSIPWIAPYLAHKDEAIREQAALALGESRRAEAFRCLREAWDSAAFLDMQRTLIRAAVLHRSDTAFDWLVSLVAEARVPVAEMAIEGLAIYKHNAQLETRLREAVGRRNSPSLTQALDRHWA